MFLYQTKPSHLAPLPVLAFLCLPGCAGSSTLTVVNKSGHVLQNVEISAGGATHGTRNLAPESRHTVVTENRGSGLVTLQFSIGGEDFVVEERAGRSRNRILTVLSAGHQVLLDQDGRHVRIIKSGRAKDEVSPLENR